MEKSFSASEIEKKWYSKWQETGAFKADASSVKPPFTIVIPPPNVTGALHMGHALNNTLQDILIRYKRMAGFEALWLPGTDHAGIATQSVVEKKVLREESKTRHDLGREELLKRIWDWKEQFGNRILDQLKGLGASCDWSRTRFTLDDVCARAVRETFVNFYNEGLIYRGLRLVNWDPVTETALADDEIEYEEIQGHFWHIRYPFADGDGSVIIATTRPETMLGDTAVAVNPKDPRAEKLKGRLLRLPLTGREIPVILDDYVKKDEGTGCLKVTPAHDPNDYEIGMRHNLEQLNILNKDATINENGGKYEGLDRFAARKRIVEDLQKEGLLVKVEDHVHQVGHSYRSHAVIEPYLSEQWFVKTKPLAEKAMEAVRNGKIKFHPERYEKTYMDWLGGIRDWCISRQLWWGHRIPIWYCDDCGEINTGVEDPENCSKCSSRNLRRDPDVLDTWFSSALWPHSTLGWPSDTDDFSKFYPTSILITSRDIISLWVSRMVMTGIHNCGNVPFSDVYIHSKILDGEGKTMSKSRGNGVDPVDIIDKYGADAMRYSIAHMATESQDIRMPVEKDTDGRLISPKFDIGRAFAVKIWNASRLIFMNLEVPEINRVPELCRDYTEDLWINSRLSGAVKNITLLLDSFKFAEAASELYSLVWNDFCDWYLELIKPRLKSEDSSVKEKAVDSCLYVLDVILRIMHPFMPFLTEEIHCSFNGGDDMLIRGEWPQFSEKDINKDIEESFEKIKSSVSTIRNLRAENNIPPSRKFTCIAVTSDSRISKVLEKSVTHISGLANLEVFKLEDKKDSTGDFITAVNGPVEFIVNASEAGIDLEAEKARKEKEISEVRKYILSIEKKLSNQNFIDKAPAAVVEKEKNKLQEQTAVLNRLENSLKDIS
ncbi:MAG: valine--tRNA ligase [Fibrobacterota bacterium]